MRNGASDKLYNSTEDDLTIEEVFSLYRKQIEQELLTNIFGEELDEQCRTMAERMTHAANIVEEMYNTGGIDAVCAFQELSLSDEAYELCEALVSGDYGMLAI